MNRSATVFVVDDDAGARQSMRWLLESEGLLAETYGSAREFLKAYDPGCPGCLILDLMMPDMDGLALQEALVSRGASPPIIFVTGHGDVPSCAEAMKAGAVDFLEKPVDDEALLKLVHAAIERDRRQRTLEGSRPGVAACIERLTPRERQVMERLYAGKSAKAIARELGICVQTVAKHRTRVLGKMKVRSDAELARLLAGHEPEGF